MYKLSIIASIILFLAFLVIPSGMSLANQKEVRILVVHKDKKDEVSTFSKEPLESKYEVLTVPQSEIPDTLLKLKQNKDIDYAEVDQLAFTQNVPNDTYFSEQIQDFSSMNILEAWEEFHPKEEVTVAIVDSGIDLQHPDLHSRLVEGKNFINDKEPPMDNTGHGTHVAGLVGAITNNGTGISSPAQNVNLMPVKVFEGKTTYMSTVIEGIRYAADHGADIINLSLGSYSNMKSLEDAVQYAVNKGILVVSAAGNDNEHAVLYPANYPNVLAVGSIDSSFLTKSDFSNYGGNVNVSAPGTNIFSTWINGYHSLSGTSMSTAIVSSVSSIVKQQYPFLKGLQVKEILESSSTPLPDVELLGKGLINAKSSLDYVQTKRRISGATSVETAIEISKAGWENLRENEVTINGESQKGKFVILASGLSFPDSLAASPLASYLDSPILLVKNELTSSLKEELKRLAPTHVLIIGGEAAIAKDIEKEINNLNIKIKRIYGENRYETAVAINNLIPFKTNKAFVVSGENYPDALSIASYSGSKLYPVLFVQKETIPSDVQTYIKAKGITKPYVIGGEAVIGKGVMDGLQGEFRISGTDRYETNYKVQQTFSTDEGGVLYFATGENFPDGLSISPLASRTGSPVLLVNNNDTTILKDTTQLLATQNYRILGGAGAISVENAWKIDDYMR
ncbi:S8 family serine peptidase [Rossellomorea aquimaris]|uniref:cell wall-binding repeat-containing protein n=1 Tax=Rossellomorea aquimaris TaxID=189382 RepID=UPI001CD27FC1|nr:cell wall-binding repeat-containing protein [Rossellomorea aquimaris]MCA1060809.1 S8 family serine peptidase [Rossellomorea aquimaris]